MSKIIKKNMTEKKSIFGKLLGKVLGNEKKPEIKKSHLMDNDKSQIKKSSEELKKEEAMKAAKIAQKKKQEEEERKKAELKNKEDQEDQGDQEDQEDNDDSAKKRSFGDKFKKDGIKKPKSLKEIADEAEEKRKAMEGKAFSESDAAQKDLKKSEEGHSKFVKKKTKKALEGKVFLIRGKDNGRAAWHYVLVSPEKIKELRHQKSGTNIDVTDFGKIIRSGWGENPSEEIEKEIEEEYGD
jgi:hypothetical protein